MSGKLSVYNSGIFAFPSHFFFVTYYCCVTDFIKIKFYQCIVAKVKIFHHILAQNRYGSYVKILKMQFF